MCTILLHQPPRYAYRLPPPFPACSCGLRRWLHATVWSKLFCSFELHALTPLASTSDAFIYTAALLLSDNVAETAAIWTKVSRRTQHASTQQVKV